MSSPSSNGIFSQTVSLLTVIPVPQDKGEVVTNGAVPQDKGEGVEVIASSTEFVWSVDWAKALLSAYQDHKPKFANVSYKKKTVWNLIRSNMIASLPHCKELPTLSQVQTKWNTMVSAYKRVCDHNAKSGNNRRTCPFYNEIDAIMSGKANVSPVAISSPGHPSSVIIHQPTPTTTPTPATPTTPTTFATGTPTPSSSEASPSEPVPEEDASRVHPQKRQNDCTVEGKQKKKRLTSSMMRQDVVNLAKTLREGQQERQAKADKRHNEKIARLDALTAVLQRLADK